MGDASARAGTSAAPLHGDFGLVPEPAVSSKLPFLAYRQPEFTPPASPQPHYPHAAQKGFGCGRKHHPARLQMDPTQSPTYEGHAQSPTSDSPPLPPIGLPSPKYPTRQRAPTLLRHAALPPTSQPVNGFQPTASPVIAPAMMHQGSGPGSPDLRAIFNPLASNPVNQSGPSWAAATDDVPPNMPVQRNRGMTSSSQTAFQPHPPLRSVTSIPDYAQFRTNNRANLSGTYKPNRGVPNWSHNDYYPPPVRQFRGEEPRASFRSGWTNGSSSLMEASDTETRSIATARSSVASEQRASLYSREHSRDRLRDRDDSPETMQISELPDDDYNMDAVDDVIDAYCYDEEDSKDDLDRFDDRNHLRYSSSPTPLDSEPPELSQTPSRDLDSLSSLHSSDHLKDWDERPSSYALAFGAPATKPRPVLTHNVAYISNDRTINHSQMTSIQRDMSKLPQLPMNKSRLSRHDWAEIEAYSKRHSKRPSATRTISTDSIVAKDAALPLQSPPMKISEPLPELDEDETIPRRASTSVYDRKSALFNLGMIASGALASPKPTVGQGPPTPQQLPASRTLPTQVRKASSPAERDRYGFKKASDKVTVQQYNAWASKYEDHISRRRNKWIALMSKHGLSTTNPTKFPDMCDKVKRYVRKGYPPEWRGAMWWYYSGGQHMIAQTEMVGLYASLVARVKRGELNKDDKDAIERDLDRTFPDNIHFRPEPATDLLDGEADDEPQLIQDLREVLAAFALNNPNIGYCQSLNFIAGLLLLFLKQDKEKAFVMLTIITRNHLPGAHARNLANTEVNVLMMLIKDYLPKVWASINDTDLINSGAGSHAHPSSKFQRQPTVALSCTSWFMSIFVGVLPIETVLRVWDTFLYEGPRALYRYALAIFKLSEPEIRKYRPSDPEIFMIVQNMPRTCLDPNILHEYAFVKKGFGNLSQGVIDQKRLFWRDQNKTAHQTSVKSTRHNQLGPTTRDDETDNDSLKKSMHGLRRKASRKFRRMRK
ncbi:rab-GTPase-TBC domain-containing protein [Phaeosphaeria sp. MPI-PUGE-AT-0046c]|nr:rab-GTPase-TBC domain-containing protein [Phaeosphaeria sp. MPI-PUGE-AT-0046c]